MMKYWLTKEEGTLYDPVIYLVLPCYNEEEILMASFHEILPVWMDHIEKKLISADSRVLFCDDGSTDRTWSCISEICHGNHFFEGIRLSKNRGHQIVLTAGIEYAVQYADAIVTMDADLQQDIHALKDFIEKFRDGFDVVYGIRKDRKTDGIAKKAFSTLYYRLLRFLGADVVEQSADYRLLSRRAAEALLMYEEANIFVRGVIPTIGFHSSEVYFDVKERKAGRSKYTFKRMLQLALDGITSFSIRPIRMIFYSGIIVSVVSMIMMMYAVITYYTGNTAVGWASLSASIWFLGGCQLTGIGVIGEYVGRTFLESKKRPRYFIEDSITNEEKKYDTGEKLRRVARMDHS